MREPRPNDTRTGRADIDDTRDLLFMLDWVAHVDLMWDEPQFAQ